MRGIGWRKVLSRKQPEDRTDSRRLPGTLMKQMLHLPPYPIYQRSAAGQVASDFSPTLDLEATEKVTSRGVGTRGSNLMKIGDRVVFTGDLAALLIGLPPLEVEMIRKAIKTAPFRLTELRDDGSAEIEICPALGYLHFFYVSSTAVAPLPRS